MRLKPDGKKVRLLDLEPGTLFMLDDCIAVKSEYLLDCGKIEAIIVGSGEFFHGAKTIEEQYNLMVQPLEIVDDCEDAVPAVLCKYCFYFDDTHCVCYNKYGLKNPKPDDFCSHGERKSNG